MHPYRVFVSYSHENRQQAGQVVEHLRRIGLEPMWDEDLLPGVPFADQIKIAIAYSHVFLPLLTQNAPQKPWVHHEIGYALGVHVPVLPVVIGAAPRGIIQQFHAASVAPDLHDLADRLRPSVVEFLVKRGEELGQALFECAEYPEERTVLLTKYAKEILTLGQHGRVRYAATLTSYSIPDALLNDPIWATYDGNTKRSDAFHRLLREERTVLETHARQEGCDLIIDPYWRMKSEPTETWNCRLAILRSFLEGLPDERVRVAIRRGGHHGNLLIVGDWFLAESVMHQSRTPRRGRGLLNTICTRHAPTVLRRIRQFDEEFEFVTKDLRNAGRSSREAAIDKIQSIIDSRN